MARAYCTNWRTYPGHFDFEVKLNSGGGQFGGRPLSSEIHSPIEPDNAGECFHIDDQFSSIVASAFHLFFIGKFFPQWPLYL